MSFDENEFIYNNSEVLSDEINDMIRGLEGIESICEKSVNSEVNERINYLNRKIEILENENRKKDTIINDLRNGRVKFKIYEEFITNLINYFKEVDEGAENIADSFNSAVKDDKSSENMKKALDIAFNYLKEQNEAKSFFKQKMEEDREMYNKSLSDLKEIYENKLYDDEMITNIPDTLKQSIIREYKSSYENESRYKHSLLEELKDINQIENGNSQSLEASIDSLAKELYDQYVKALKKYKKISKIIPHDIFMELYHLSYNALGKQSDEIGDKSPLDLFNKFIKNCILLCLDSSNLRETRKLPDNRRISDYISELISELEHLDQLRTQTRGLLVQQATEISKLRETSKSTSWLSWAKRLYMTVTDQVLDSDDIPEIRSTIEEVISNIVAQRSLALKAAGSDSPPQLIPSPYRSSEEASSSLYLTPRK